MTELPQRRRPDRCTPIRRAQPTEKSASGPGDRVASARDVAIYFREDCRTLRDSLQLEMVAAQYHLRLRDVRTTAGVPAGDFATAGVIAELAREGDPLSHAILRAVAHVGVGDPAERSGMAAAHLTERAVGLPQEFADVGKAAAAGAWRTSAGVDGEYALFADFVYPRAPRHAVALYVNPRRGEIVKHIGLLSAMTTLDPGEPFHPKALEAVEIAHAGAVMRRVLECSYGPLAASSDDYRVLIAAARARSMGLTARPASGEAAHAASRSSL